MVLTMKRPQKKGMLSFSQWLTKRQMPAMYSVHSICRSGQTRVVRMQVLL